jgi:hypothetical protein
VSAPRSGRLFAGQIEPSWHPPLFIPVRSPVTVTRQARSDPLVADDLPPTVALEAIDVGAAAAASQDVRLAFLDIGLERPIERDLRLD